MITELKEIIDKIGQLPEEDQRLIAKMLDEEMQWDKTLQDTQGLLDKLADEAVKEHQLGKTKNTDW